MDLTFEDVYFNEYLDYLKIKNKVTTIELIKFKFKNHILPFFAKMSIYEITDDDYIRFQLEIKKLNYSDSFYEQVHIMCKKFFDYCEKKYNTVNIALKVGLIKNYSYKRKNNHKIWSKKQYKKLINSVDDKVYKYLFETFYEVGARKGEILALQVCDLKKYSLSIYKSITKELFNGQHLLLKPKSETSIRDVNISIFLYFKLKSLIKYYKQNYSNFNDEFFLFGGDKSISTTTLKRKFDKYCDIAGVERIRIHDLRHSHASYLFKKKIPIDLISRRLGHSSVSITLNTYIHSDEVQEKRLTKAINLLHF